MTETLARAAPAERLRGCNGQSAIAGDIPSALVNFLPRRQHDPGYVKKPGINYSIWSQSRPSRVRFCAADTIIPDQLLPLCRTVSHFELPNYWKRNGASKAMTISDTYNVVTTGQILDGFDPADVRERLVSVLRLKPEQAEHFFEQRRVVKKGISWASADKICGQLATLGVGAEIQNPAPPVEAPPAEPKLSLQEPALEIVQDEAEASPKAGTIECPNCGHVQAKSEQCENCGVWFHKFESSAAPVQPVGAPPAMAAAAVPAAETAVETVQSSTVIEESSINLVAIGAAAAAALVGAWIWYFVAVTFEFEFGLIAWAIGGAVGFAAASAGSRGVQAGVVCAMLALGAIVVGKYWAYSAFVDQFQDAIASVSEFDQEMHDYYEEEMQDARMLVRGSGSDDFIRRFMVERGYTDASDPARVSDEELEYFREYVEPELRAMAESRPDFEEWQASSVAALDEISPWEMMRADFGVLDIIFAFLGIGTAFRLGSQSD